MPRPSALLPATPIGTRLITSTPQARATSTTPAPTSAVARSVACWLLPHWVSTVVAAIVSGRPAASHAVRPMLNACSPTWLTQPPTTWSISAGSMPGALDDRLLDGAEHLGRVHGGQATIALADGGADGIDDHDVAHARSLRGGSRSQRAEAARAAAAPSARPGVARGGRLRWRIMASFIPSLTPPAAPSGHRYIHVIGADGLRRRSPGRRRVGRALPRHASATYGLVGGRRAPRRRPVVRRGSRPVHVLRPGVARPSGCAAGRAVQLVEWARTHRFCGRCGTPTEPSAGERSMKCPACGLLAFPRLAPAMITLVTRGEPGPDQEALLARGVQFRAPDVLVPRRLRRAGEIARGRRRPRGARGGRRRRRQRPLLGAASRGRSRTA